MTTTEPKRIAVMIFIRKESCPNCAKAPMVRSMVRTGLRRKVTMLDNAGFPKLILEMVTIATGRKPIAQKKESRLIRLLRFAWNSLYLYRTRLTAVKHKSVTTPHRKTVENILPTSY